MGSEGPKAGVGPGGTLQVPGHGLQPEGLRQIGILHGRFHGSDAREEPVELLVRVGRQALGIACDILPNLGPVHAAIEPWRPVAGTGKLAQGLRQAIGELIRHRPHLDEKSGLVPARLIKGATRPGDQVRSMPDTQGRSTNAKDLSDVSAYCIFVRVHSNLRIYSYIIYHRPALLTN